MESQALLHSSAERYTRLKPAMRRVLRIRVLVDADFAPHERVTARPMGVRGAEVNNEAYTTS